MKIIPVGGEPVSTTYEKLIMHAKCIIEIDDGIWNSAIEIANYDDGANLAIECMKCNEVLIDVNRPSAPYNN